LVDTKPLDTTSDVPVAAPIAGVTNVGVLLKTTLPVPVEEVVPVPPETTGRVPVVRAVVEVA
jgi:hypothetical protein